MDISVITINYNNALLTVNFVKSVIAVTTSKLKYEIIVIDNASSKEDYVILNEDLNNVDGVRLIKSKINLGFGGGNMLGVQYASGKYYAFINNDIVFEEDCLNSLFSFMNENKNVGVVTPQQLNKDGNPVSCFDYFHGIRKEILGRKFVELFLPKNKDRRENKQYTKTCCADFIQGCFMFFDANSFAQVGGFDTNIFLYYEEMDICLRLKKEGLKSCLYPETKFLHYHGVSTGKNFAIKKELQISYLYVIKKNYSYLKYLIIKSIVLFKLFFKSIVSPRHIELFLMVLMGSYLQNSLKLKQKIQIE